MADDLWSFKDIFLIKAPKNSPLVLRMIVVLFAMICGVYICSICLQQVSTRTKSGFLNIEVIQRPCPQPDVEPDELRYMHYPKPNTYSRAECACNPVQYFAILSMQRSGSGWFETLLNNHTNISSNGEIFSVKVRRSNISTIVETLDRLYNLDWLSSASKNECTTAVGLKWMLNQGLMQHHEEIVEYFNTRGVSAIFLFRRNLLRRMISVLANLYDRDNKLLNGTHKSHVHSPHEAAILAKYKPTINATLLIHNLKQVQDTTTKALEYFKSTRHIILYYEDIVKNRTKLLDVQDFLKVPKRDLKSRQVKIHKGNLSSQIENWGDVQKTLTGTQYESFLSVDYRRRIRRGSSSVVQMAGHLQCLLASKKDPHIVPDTLYKLCSPATLRDAIVLQIQMVTMFKALGWEEFTYKWVAKIAVFQTIHAMTYMRVKAYLNA